MAKRWRIESHDVARISALERTAGVSAVVAQLLVARGITDPAVAKQFLDPKLTHLRDPESLPGVPEAAERIMAAVADRRPIVVYGDYDVDGMTGASILLLCLRLLDAEVTAFVPNRLDDGYGLHCDSIRALAERGAKLVISVDCGITAVEPARTARSLGIELIITDHHDLAAELPAAAAIVHPRLPGTNYPFAGLCGAGVAFKLAWALCQRASQAKKVSERMRGFLLQAVGLAAMGTVADVSPLVDENRVLVRHGLTSLKGMPTIGLKALMKAAELDKKPELSSEDIAFAIAPRLNAAGRLGQAALAIELLTTSSEDRATALAEYLNELNRNRESLERSVYLAANKMASEAFDPAGDSALVLAERGWHPGVIGIVASRLAEKYHRPVALVALDALGIKPGVGSARSVPGFDLGAALGACSHNLVSHGGHSAAAGFKIEEGQVEAFRASFCEHAAGEISGGDRVGELRIDAEAAFSSLTLSAVQQMERLAPFGAGNPRPLLCATSVILREPPRKIGGGDRHLALRLAQHGVDIRAVAFGGGEWAEPLSKMSGPIAVAFRPIINHFRGRNSVELQVCDWREATPAQTAAELCA